MTGKGKHSARFSAMTARDEAAEHGQRQAELSRRASARFSARRAALNRTPLATTKPKAAEWRKYPSGQTPGEQPVDQVWSEVAEAYEGRPPQPQEQNQQVYGSQRPLSAKERQYQIEMAEERRARKRLQAIKEQAKEKKAIQKFTEKQRELAYMRGKAKMAKPSTEGYARKHKAKEIRDRLQAVQERERAWKERVTV